MKLRILLVIYLLVGLFGCLVSALWMVACILFSPTSPRAVRIAIAYDQLGNTMTGGNEDETISSRAGRLRKEGRGWACVLCKLLDWLKKDHCEKSIGV